MKINAVIFDLDGTLLDTLEDIMDSANAVLEKLGFPPHTRNEYRYFVGEGIEQLMLRALPEKSRSKETLNQVVHGILMEYDLRWKRKTKPFDGILELLSYLKAQDIKTAVFSNKPHEFTQKSVDHFFPAEDFTQIVGAQKEIPKKPDPAGALRIAETFGLPPSEIVFLGDSDIDMKTAKAAGMMACGVLWGFRDEKELRENGADLVLRKPMELVKILES